MERPRRKRGEEAVPSERRLLQASSSASIVQTTSTRQASAIEPATRAPSFDSASAFSRDLL